MWHVFPLPWGEHQPCLSTTAQLYMRDPEQHKFGSSETTCAAPVCVLEVGGEEHSQQGGCLP